MSFVAPHPPPFFILLLLLLLAQDLEMTHHLFAAKAARVTGYQGVAGALRMQIKFLYHKHQSGMDLGHQVE